MEVWVVVELVGSVVEVGRPLVKALGTTVAVMVSCLSLAGEAQLV